MKPTCLLVSSLGLLGATSALAADPVVVVGAVEGATATLAAATGRPESDFASVAVVEVLEGTPPFLTGGGRVLRCGGAPAAAGDFAAAVDALERAVLGGAEDAPAPEPDAPPAGPVELASRADTMLSCLSEPADPAVVARHHLLVGAIAFEAGEEESAEDAFLAARIFDAGLAWPQALPADGKPLFDRTQVVLAAEAPVLFGWTVPPGTDLRLDGAKAEGVEAPVPPGEHLIQWGSAPTRTVRVVLEGAAVSLVVPEALVGEAEALALDAERRDLFSSILASRYPPDGVVWVVSKDAAFKVVPGTASWEEVERTVATAEPEDPGAKKPRKEPIERTFPVGLVVAGIGGAAVLGGAIPAALCDAEAQKLASAGHKGCRCHLAIERRSKAMAVMYAGGVVLAAGVGLQLLEPIPEEKAGPVVASVRVPW